MLLSSIVIYIDHERAITVNTFISKMSAIYHRGIADDDDDSGAASGGKGATEVGAETAIRAIGCSDSDHSPIRGRVRAGAGDLRECREVAHDA